MRHKRVPCTNNNDVAPQEASFAAVTHWFATHGDTHGVSDAEVRLCVAVTPPPAAGERVESQSSGCAEDDDDPLDKSALAWCIDHGFEHVPASPPEADGEPAGVARVREALHAHTWPGLVAKPRCGGGSTSRAVEKPAAVEEAGEEDGITDGGSHERFEVLMAHMMRARDAAATVPDDVRRATAAELAMRMAQLLGVDDEGESDGCSDELVGEDHGSEGYEPLVE